MRIVKVVATDPHTNEKQIFTFGTSSDAKAVVTTRGGRLGNYLEFCFEQAECTRDVETEFFVNGEQYSLSRLHNDDGTTRTVLKKLTYGSYQVVARARASEYIESLIGTSVSPLLRLGYVNNKAVESFHGDLKKFDVIRLLYEVRDSIDRYNVEAKAMKDSAMRRLKKYAADAVPASPEDLDSLNNELDTLVRDITVATAQLGELKAKQNVDTIRADIKVQLNDAQNKYNKLISRQADIEEARAKVKLRDDLELLIPKVRTFKSVIEQRDQYEKRRFEITGELEWQENELSGVRQQLEEKNKQYALTQDKRNRIESINNELNYIASLYEKNKALNEQLLELNEKQERLTAEKALYADRLAQVEKTINEVREDLDAFNIPARSVGELLEAVRVDVKIDEVNAQIEKLTSELAVKDSQIAEKESNLVVQVKRFRAVAELDRTVTPFKARETILQVLDTKYSKLDTINLSLKEKQRNLERALEDYKYRLIQLEQSRSRLESERDKTLLRKQEEFKREVYLNSQKVFSDDATSVFAVTVNFNDREVEALNQEITARNLDRDLLLERAYRLDGSIKEIKRHIEINSAEMETLQREKDNINRRYNEIVSQNTNETVFNYLKALSSDNGTKYLLDVQQDAVRSEAELAELKRSTESLRAKVSALKSRLGYLSETRAGFDDTRVSIENLISTNDKLKDELSGIGEKLSGAYEQYKSFTRQMENIESRLDDVKGAIIENVKTVKVNEQQIAESTAKAQNYAGTDDLEKAITNFRYELGDVESELQMLNESAQTMDKEIFKKRLELEKTQWLYDSKCAEYEELHRELQLELDLKGLNVDNVAAMDLDYSVEELRRVIFDFDTKRQSLAEKIDNLYSILKNRPASDVSQEEIDTKRQEIELLTKRQEELEDLRDRQLSQYIAASRARAKVGVAAAEANTLNSLKETIGHNEIISVLIQDKIKSVLLTATQYLGFVGSGMRLVEQDGKLQIKQGDAVIDYDDLPDGLKTSVYVALVLALPNTDSSDGKWIVFEEKINADRESLDSMLNSVADISYVVNFDRDTPRFAMYDDDDGDIADDEPLAETDETSSEEAVASEPNDVEQPAEEQPNTEDVSEEDTSVDTVDTVADVPPVAETDAASAEPDEPTADTAAEQVEPISDDEEQTEQPSVEAEDAATEQVSQQSPAEGPAEEQAEQPVSPAEEISDVSDGESIADVAPVEETSEPSVEEVPSDERPSSEDDAENCASEDVSKETVD